jgi:hypothetical protein
MMAPGGDQLNMHADDFVVITCVFFSCEISRNTLTESSQRRFFYADFGSDGWIRHAAWMDMPTVQRCIVDVVISGPV